MKKQEEPFEYQGKRFDQVEFNINIVVIALIGLCIWGLVAWSINAI